MNVENHQVTKRLQNSMFYFDRGYIIEITEDCSFYQVSKCVCGGGVFSRTKQDALTKAIHCVDELIRRESTVTKDIEKDIEKELLKFKNELATRIQSVCYKYTKGE